METKTATTKAVTVTANIKQCAEVVAARNYVSGITKTLCGRSLYIPGIAGNRIAPSQDRVRCSKCLARMAK